MMHHFVHCRTDTAKALGRGYMSSLMSLNRIAKMVTVADFIVTDRHCTTSNFMAGLSVGKYKCGMAFRTKDIFPSPSS